MMEGSIVAALVSLGGLILLNIIISAYQYGQLRQQVTDFCRRVDRLEDIEDRRKNRNDTSK